MQLQLLMVDETDNLLRINYGLKRRAEQLMSPWMATQNARKGKCVNVQHHSNKLVIASNLTSSNDPEVRKYLNKDLTNCKICSCVK